MVPAEDVTLSDGQPPTQLNKSFEHQPETAIIYGRL